MLPRDTVISLSISSVSVSFELDSLLACRLTLSLGEGDGEGEGRRKEVEGVMETVGDTAELGLVGVSGASVISTFIVSGNSHCNCTNNFTLDLVVATIR